jgi:hypothetical protein
MPADRGWVSYGPGDNSHLPDDVRRDIERRIEERGALLAIVEVRVFEHDEVPQVSFPPGSPLGVDTEAPVIAELVTRAREELAHWR